tara:strand:+ start:1506 stop:2072 length:567 start_codon:yes stop_codon:yes gene_type:complete
MKSPPPQALYLDEDPPGREGFSLLYSRMLALQKHGDEQMTERDLKHYSVEEVIRLIKVKILQFYYSLIPSLEKEGDWRDLSGTYRCKDFLFEEINRLEKETMTESEEPTPPTAKATKTLELICNMRRARQTIESQFADLRSVAKTKIDALKKAECALLDDRDDGQLSLFELDPAITEEVTSIIDNPEI